MNDKNSGANSNQCTVNRGCVIDNRNVALNKFLANFVCIINLNFLRKKSSRHFWHILVCLASIETFLVFLGDDFRTLIFF